jgi:hypothetical protein
MELVKTATKPSVVDPSLHFSFVCDELAKITAAHGYNLKATNAVGMKQFRSLPIPQQLGINQALESYVQQIRLALKEQVDITGDNCKHAWWALAKMGLRAPAGVFEQIHASDIIEIYNAESIQVFRSFEMFQYLSYSLSEIFAFDWLSLYERDEFVFRRILDTVKQVLEGKITGPTHTNFPPHVVEEKFSEKKCWAKMEHILISPLHYADGTIGGYVSTCRLLECGSV